MLEDREISCQDCGSKFVFTAGEQLFFVSKRLRNEPKRCANCRLVVRFRRKGHDLQKLYDTVCGQCGAPAKVPFTPRGHKPVFCVSCLMIKREETKNSTNNCVLDAS